MSQAVVSQVVFRPNPGADMTKLMALVAESAAIFRKHGAEVSVWAVSTGEIGNMVFTTRYESYEAYGKCADAVFADPAYQAWSQKVLQVDSALGSEAIWFDSCPFDFSMDTPSVQ
jgi:hypothetical protein